MSTSIQSLIEKGLQKWKSTERPDCYQSIRYVTQEEDGLQIVLWKYESSTPLYTSFYIKTKPIDSLESPYHFKNPIYVTNSVQDFIDFLRYQVSMNWTYVGSCILPALDTPFIGHSIYKSISTYFDFNDSDESNHLSCRFISAI